ncbi:phenylacetate--CoA ligase family protein [Saccharopolyspora elongata]|uniref:Phenylacetate--CoA ligase family protein n=1 Tax=Saccharopolyspora elongata TaxID=2530387 RepID=A0A4R4XTI7_9PSEU|nr:phenylacetate--CoA ligase family protein [Saccharopolyspora elongata]
MMSLLRLRTALRPRVVSAVTRSVVEPVVRAPYLSTARWLPEFFTWPEQKRRSWQQDRLRAVLRHAQEEVPYYGDALAGRDVDGVDLAELPVVDKAMMRSCMDNFLSRGWRDIPHIAKKTGGSTGDPFQYPLDKRAWTQIYAANLYFWERTGYRYGDRLVMVGSPPSLQSASEGLKSRLRSLLEGRVVSAAGCHIDPETSLERALTAGRARGVLWYGYASHVAAMADAVLEAGVRVSPPKAIVTTAELLFPTWRERIEQAFEAPLHDQYGCNDGGIMSQECSLGRLHLAENVSIVEILDDAGRRCRPGEEGDVVVTNLHARALPFLRYRIGDRAVLGAATCPCGTEGTFLERVVGRQGDSLHLPNGKHVSMHPLGKCFFDARHVRRYQLVQPEPGRVLVRLDVEPGFEADERSMILGEVRRLVGSAVDIDLTTDEPMERTRGGKHRVVVRTFDPA